MNAVICTVAKNENPYINEWCHHYLNMGFSHVYIYDNNEQEAPAVDNCIDRNIKDKVTIFKQYQGLSGKHVQTSIFNEFYQNYNKQFDWCAFFDVDEFLDGVENINNFLSQEKFNDAKQIIVKWRLFGDDGVIERDISEPVYSFFKKPTITNYEPLDNCIKVIVKGNDDLCFYKNVHFAKTMKDGRAVAVLSRFPSGAEFYPNTFWIPSSVYLNETVFLNHYRTKTLAEFVEIKLPRGDDIYVFHHWGLSYFWSQNEKTPEKENWLKEHHPELVKAQEQAAKETKLKKCFGIISGFPEDREDRQRRINRFNKLLQQLNEFWPDVDILIIAQNWKDYEPPRIRNKFVIFKHEELIGILNARRELRKQFFKRDYDYIIMMDDDVIIQCNTEDAHIKYMEELDKHPQGFSAIAGRSRHWFEDYPYAPAPLNLCAVSRFIYEKEPIPDVNLQKSEALEDDVYAYLLHAKYPEYEFTTQDIKHIQFNPRQYTLQFVDPDVYLPSTWNRGEINGERLMKNTKELLLYIKEHKDLPNMEEWHKKDNEKWGIK